MAILTSAMEARWCDTARTLSQVDITEAMPYACEDVIVTNALNNVLESQLQNYPKVMLLYKSIEIPLIKIMLKLILQIEPTPTLVHT